jgi:hypothetical protein
MTNELNTSEIEGLRGEYCKKKRKCKFCNVTMLPGTYCIKNIFASVCINCFILRSIEIIGIEEFNKTYSELYSDWISKRVANNI